MYRFLSLLIAVSFCGTVMAQTSVLRGRVLSDVDSTALSGAMVVLTGNEHTSAISDTLGHFELRGVPYGPQSLQFIFLGYDNRVVPVVAKGAVTQMSDVYLTESASLIAEVVIRGEVPMAVLLSDTTQYNAEAFKTNPDADVEELITKMPGVIIQQGKIEAQGEPVRRIYVDGKLFFGTDPMAALKALPADAVESIQLFNAPSEESRLTGFDDGNTQKAINIVTKSKSKTSTIIKAEASAGRNAGRAEISPFRYLTGGNFSRFTPNHRFTFSLLSNNVNTRKFGEDEAGGGDAELDANGNIKNLPQGIQQINGAGVNYVYEKENLLKIESSYFFDYTDSHIKTHIENNFYPDQKFKQKSSVTDNDYFAKNINHRFNTRVEWKPNKCHTFVVAPRITYRTYEVDPRGSYLENNQVNLDDKVVRNRSRTYSPVDNSYFTGSSDLLWTLRFPKRGRTFTTSFTISLAENSLDQYVVDSLRQSYTYIKARDEYEWRDMAAGNWQNRHTPQSSNTNSIRGKAIWTEPISMNPKGSHRVMFSYTYRYEWSDFDKQSFTYSQQEMDYTDQDMKLTNVYSRNYTTNSLGAGYAFHSPNLTFNGDLDFQRANQHHMEELPNQIGTDRAYFDLQPSFSLKYSLSKKRYLRLQYKGRSVIPNIQLMQDVLNTTRPSFLVQGNPNLKEGYSHTLEAFYNTADTKRSTNLTITLRGTTTSNYVTNRNEVFSDPTELHVIPSDPNSEVYRTQAGALLSTPVNMDGYGTINATGTYSFTLRPIRSNINLTGIYVYTNMPSYFRENGQTLSNLARTNSIGARVGVTSNISRNVDFNVYSTTTFNDTYNTARQSDQYLNQNFYYSVNIIFWKGFVFNSVLSWRYYRSSSAPDMNLSYYVLNAAIGKKVFRNRSGEVRLSVYDMLDQNTNRLHYVRDAYIQDVQSNSLGRYVMLRFSYRFNSMSQRKGQVEVKNPQQIGVKALQNMNRPAGQQGQPTRQPGAAQKPATQRP